jgi:hypothetical protein
VSSPSRRKFFARAAPYLAWLVGSLALLLAARAYHPHIYALAAFAGAGISAVLGGIALFHGVRAFALAALAAVPTVVAFAELATYNWA